MSREPAVQRLSACARLRDVGDGCLSCPLYQYAPEFTERTAERYRCAFDRRAPWAGGKLDEWQDVVNRSFCMASRGPAQARVLCVFESPSGPEDRSGVSFSGGAARLVARCAARAGVDLSHARYAYLVRCRAVRGVDWRAISRCQRFLIEEIRAQRPDVIVAFGELATAALLGREVSVQHCAGSAQAAVVAGVETTVVPMVSPQTVLQNDWMAARFVEAFRRLGECLRGDRVEAQAAEVEIVTDVKRALEVCRALRRLVREKRRVLSVDTETSGLNPYAIGARLSVISLSASAKRGYAIVLAHDEVQWDEEARRRVIEEGLRPLLTDRAVRLRLHNAKFDVQWIAAHLGFWPRDVVEDTMLTHYALDENLSHGLKQLALRYTDLGDYDRELDQYLEAQRKATGEDARYDKVPIALLGRYAALDAVATTRLSRALRVEARRQDALVQALAYRAMPAISAMVARMEAAGIAIDMEYAERVALPHLEAEERRSRDAILAQPIVRRFIRDKEQEARAKLKKPKPIEVKRYFEFSLDSPKQLQELLYGKQYYAHEVTVVSNTGAPSTDKEALAELAAAGSPIAKAIQEYRLDQKLRSTYCAPIVQRCKEQQDARLHVNVLIHGTVTGRASTRDPNLQSTPNKGAALVKRMFVSRYGDEGCIVQFDYSQVELRILAAVSGDRRMIDAYAKGEDLHALTACVVFGMTAEEYKALPKDEQKRRRTVAKRINFGIAYGIGAPGIQHTLKSDGVIVTLDEAKRFLETFYQQFPRVAQWIERVERSTADDLYSRSLFGRRRRVEQVQASDASVRSSAMRQAVNHVIQSTAADFTWTSLVLMDQEIALRGGADARMILPTVGRREFPVDERWRRVHLVLQVHDSILADCPLELAGDVVDMFYRTMPNVVELAPLVWGEAVQETLAPMRRVRLEVEGEVGPNWRDSYKVKSGKDVSAAMRVALAKRAKLDADPTYKWSEADDQAVLQGVAS